MKEKKVQFKKTLTSAKNNWIREKLSDISLADSKTFWKRYKGFFGMDKTNYIGSLTRNGVLCNKDEDKENALFEAFFSGKHLENNTFDGTHESRVTDLWNKISTNSFKTNTQSSNKSRDLFGGTNLKGLSEELIAQSENFLNGTITEEEIVNSIKKQAKYGKCSDDLDVNPIMLQHLGSHAIRLLKKIFNGCLNTSIWGWKTSLTCFIRKEGKSSYLLPGSYRPICISSYIGKLLERILEERIRYYCDSSGILDMPQEGFSPKKSTVRYLFKLMANLHEAKRKKLTAMILLIDFQKAFDSVWLPGLITKLYHYGIRGKILALVNDFLINRKLKLMVNKLTGNIRNPCSLIGLPQGSVLSPLLFIIFIADMLNNLHSINGNNNMYGNIDARGYKFADDGTVSVIGNNITECVQKMQLICDDLKIWCDKWRLLINCEPNKTEVIVMRPKGGEDITENLIQVKIGANKLNYVRKSKVLGVIVDDELTFQPHAVKVLQSCWFHWYKIYKNTTRWYGLNISSLTLLFKTMVVSRLMYAATVWLEHQQDLFKDLWSRALLKISGSEYHPLKQHSQLLLNVDPLNLLLQTNSVKFLLKCLTSDDDMVATILQIEQEPKHRYYKQIQALKTFLCWKQEPLAEDERNSRTNTRNIQLVDYIHHKHCYYSKDEINDYNSHQWKNQLLKTSPELSIQNINRENTKILFPKGSTREENTVVAEFIHGHSLRFRNFRKSVGEDNEDTCEFCEVMVDSPEHQLLECSTFECETRNTLLSLLGNNIADLKWRVLTLQEDSEQAVKLLKVLILDINNEIENLWEVDSMDSDSNL